MRHSGRYPWGGEHTLDVLTDKKMIREAGKDEKGKRRFKLTNEGKKELKRIEPWELDVKR